VQSKLKVREFKDLSGGGGFWKSPPWVKSGRVVGAGVFRGRGRAGGSTAPRQIKGRAGPAGETPPPPPPPPPPLLPPAPPAAPLVPACPLLHTSASAYHSAALGACAGGETAGVPAAGAGSKQLPAPRPGDWAACLHLVLGRPEPRSRLDSRLVFQGREPRAKRVPLLGQDQDSVHFEGHSVMLTF